MIEAEHLTKRYGKRVTVEDVSFAAQPDRVMVALPASIEVRGLTKRYGNTVAVDHLSSMSIQAGLPAFLALTAPASPPRCG